MRLTVPDDLADKYLPSLPAAGSAPHQQRTTDAAPPSLEALLLRVLDRGLPLAEEGAIVLSRSEAALLTSRLQIPEGAGAPQILDGALAMCDMKIGKFRLSLPAPVLRGLKDRAEREGKELQVFVQQIVDKITEEVAQYA